MCGGLPTRINSCSQSLFTNVSVRRFVLSRSIYANSPVKIILFLPPLFHFPIFRRDFTLLNREDAERAPIEDNVRVLLHDLLNQVGAQLVVAHACP